MAITDKDREKWAVAVDDGKAQVWEKLKALVEASAALQEAINNPDFLGDAPTAISGPIKLSMNFQSILNSHIDAGDLMPVYQPRRNVEPTTFNAATDAMFAQNNGGV